MTDYKKIADKAIEKAKKTLESKEVILNTGLSSAHGITGYLFSQVDGESCPSDIVALTELESAAKEILKKGTVKKQCCSEAFEQYIKIMDLIDELGL